MAFALAGPPEAERKSIESTAHIYLISMKKRHTPPAQVRRNRLARWSVAAIFASLAAVSVAHAQTPTIYTWNKTSTTYGHNTSSVPDNWNVGATASSKYPGVSSRGNSGGTSSDIAEDATAGALTTTSSLQINFGTTSNGVGALLTIGAFVYDPTGTGNTEFLGTNATSNGTLAFTGVTYSGNSNVVISNMSGGQGVLTIQPTNSSTGVMSLQLAGGVNTIVSGIGSGSTFGNTTTITTSIADGASASSITFLGNGDSAGANRGGTLSLGGSSNFTGGITIGIADGTQAGRVRITAAAALPTTGNFTVNPNSQLRLDQAGGATYGVAGQTLNLNSLGAAAASATNISNGGLRLDPATTGSATFNPALNLAGASAIDVESGSTLTVAGIISGTGTLSKQGAGTLTLTNSNTNSGTVSISAGTLLVSGSINGSPSVQVTGTGALTLTTTASVLSDSGNLSLVTGTTLNLNGPANTSETVGTLTLDGTTEAAGTYTYTQLSALDPGVNFGSSAGETLTVAVPEPTTVLGGALLVSAAAFRMRRRSLAAQNAPWA